MPHSPIVFLSVLTVLSCSTPISGGVSFVPYLLDMSSPLNVLKQKSKQKEFPVWPLSGHCFPCFDQLSMHCSEISRLFFKITLRNNGSNSTLVLKKISIHFQSRCNFPGFITGTVCVALFGEKKKKVCKRRSVLFLERFLASLQTPGCVCVRACVCLCLNHQLHTSCHSDSTSKYSHQPPSPALGRPPPSCPAQ